MKWRFVLLSGVLLILGYLFATPYITAYRMKVAAENQDGEALSELVDFPALRQSLNDQLDGKFRQKMVKDIIEGNPLSAIGTAFGSRIVRRMVDKYVTPDGIMKLMKGRKPDSEGDGNEASGQKPSGPFSDISASYESFSTFAIIARDHEFDLEVKLIFWRRGIEWKLSEIILPIN